MNTPTTPGRPITPVGVTRLFKASVVIATYNRPQSVQRLLTQLAAQTIAAESFEVVVVDDGSASPVAAALSRLALPYRLLVIVQENGGPAAARHAGIHRASGDIVVVVDDDMWIERDFLESHLAAHEASAHRVVLGRLREHPDVRLRLFERLQLDLLDKLFDDVAAGRRKPRGSDLYTGNVSFRRTDYLAVGGFDQGFRLSEDSELGVRLETIGAEFVLSDAAFAWHASDHASLAGWMRRGVAYGAADVRMAEKHPGRVGADPWRFLFMVHPVSRGFLLASVLAPSLLLPVAWAAMGLATALAWLRLERVALAGATFTYGIQYFRGVRAAAGSRRAALGGLARHLNDRDGASLRFFARWAKCFADVHADHAAMARGDAKYKATPRRPRLIVDAVQRIGFQMMIAYRVMRALRDTHLGFFAKLASRAIRHGYAAEIHWDADLAPGIVIVHGTGLVIGHGARVGPGCVLFQGITLGESIDPVTRAVGAPTLEADVHVGPGAMLLGPIVVGRGTKIMATAVLMQSVPPDSIVEVPLPTVRPRLAGYRAGVFAPDRPIPGLRPGHPTGVRDVI